MSAPDVVVIGGGPAGLASAIAMRQRGLDIVVLERRARRNGLDKPCGEGLMPPAVEALARLGVGLEPGRDGMPFDHIAWREGHFDIVGKLPAPGLGVRRTRLHRALLHRAEQVGVDLRFGVPAEVVVRDRRYGVQVQDAVLSPRFVVGADGLRSPTRHRAGLAGPGPRVHRFGMRRHFGVRPWSDAVEVYWSRLGEAYVTPVAEQEVGVALLFASARLPYEALLAHFPALLERLSGAPATTPVQGTGPLEQRVRAVAKGNLALVGDASGYVDAITGEGIDLALRQAEALAAALEANRLPRYSRAHRRAVRRPEILTRATLLLSRHPALRRRVFAALAAEPALFDRLLALNVESSRSGVGGRLWGLGPALSLARAMAITPWESRPIV